MSNHNPTPRPAVPPEHQEQLYSAIASELIELTPETWQAAVLDVAADRSRAGAFGMTHSIRSPEGHREPIVPSDELFDMTHSLLKFFEEFGQPWTRMTFSVKALPEEGWSFSSELEYDA
jgi:hypothetical protein